MAAHPLSHRAVFLDRDGVINRASVRNGKPYPPAGLSELEILPGVAKALTRLRAAQFRLVVVTNQPDVARGTQSRDTVEGIHARLREIGLPIDAFYVCYHDGPAKCACRKPNPGMLLAAGADLFLDLEQSFMVGDRWRDIEAGQRAGCTPFFVDYGYDEPRPRPPYVAVNSLADAADWILDGVSARGLAQSKTQAPFAALGHSTGCGSLPGIGGTHQSAAPGPSPQ